MRLSKLDDVDCNSNACTRYHAYAVCQSVSIHPIAVESGWHFFAVSVRVAAYDARGETQTALPPDAHETEALDSLPVPDAEAKAGMQPTSALDA